MSKPSRYKGLRPNPEKLGVTPLAEGESTRTYRVRAQKDVLTWFGRMSAEERGRFIEEAYSLIAAAALDPAQLKTFRFSGSPLGTPGGPTSEQIISEGRGEK